MTAPAAPDEPLRTAALLNVIMLLCGVAQFAVPALAPVIARDVGVDPTWLGTYSALMWAASLTTSASAGSLIARFGAWRLSQLALAGSGIGLIAAAAGSLAPLAFAAIVIGMAIGVETPASSTILARVTPLERAPFIFSFKQTGLQVGGFATGALLPAIALAFGWRGVFAAAGVVLALASTLLVRPRHLAMHAGPTRPPLSLRQAFALTVGDARLLRMALMAFAFVGTQVCFFTFLVTFFVADHAVPIVTAGGYLALAQAGGLVGRLTFGSVAGRWIGSLRLLALLGLGMALACLALAVLTEHLATPLRYLLAFAGGLTAAGWNGLYLAEIARLAPPGEVAQITGASFVISTIGLILAPAIYSAVAAGSDYGAGFAAAATLALAGVALLVWPARRARL